MSHLRTLFVAAILLPMLFPMGGQAKSLRAKLFDGGTINAITVDPITPATLYAATFDAGVFKSTNGGATWYPARTGLGVDDVRSVTIDPVTPATLYAGTSAGLFKSIDGGGRWNALPRGADRLSITRVVVDPETSTTLYGVGTSDQASGVFKSTDGGVSWAVVRAGLASVVAIDPVAPNVVYAVTIAGVVKTVNGGASWAAASTGIVAGVVSALAIDPTSTNVVYVGTSAGVFKTTDAGATWSPARSGLDSAAVDSLVVDSTNPAMLYAGSSSGGTGSVYKSSDGAASWTRSDTGLPTVPGHARIGVVAVAATTPPTVFAGDIEQLGGKGMFRSLDEGDTWNACNTGLAASAPPLTNVVVSPADPSTVYTSTLDRVFKTTTAGATWQSSRIGFPADAFLNYALAVDPVDSNTIYASFEVAGPPLASGLYKSVDGGTTWNPADGGLPSDAFVSTIAIDATNPSTIYAGWNGLFKSIDGGTNWVSANTGLPIGARIYSIVIDPAMPTTLYAADFYSGVYRSTDAGATWTSASNGLPANRSVGPLIVDPSVPTTLYAGMTTFSPPDGVYKSVDGGVAWSPINSGIDLYDMQVIFGIAIDPALPTTLYAGTYSLGSQPTGLFETTDAGATWARVVAIPDDAHGVRAVVVAPSSPKRVFVATARGMYVYGPECGDGVVEDDEPCDDGNTGNDDACTILCAPNVCGDGFVRVGVEQCDDGETADGDGCDHACRIEPSAVSETVAANDTVSTDAGNGATASQPLQVSVTTPNAGTITISRTGNTIAPPSAFSLLSGVVDITAPSATPETPLVILFALDASVVPSGQGAATIVVEKDGTPVPPCTGPPGEAVPDPCVTGRSSSADGDIGISILSSSASAWAVFADPCGVVPQTGCREPGPKKASLALRAAAPDPSKASLVWTWAKGSAVDLGDLGDPVSGTDYALCLYDDLTHGGRVRAYTIVAHGGTCAGSACWKTAKGGFKYGNKSLSPNGVKEFSLKSGSAGKAQFKVKGKGVELALPPLPLTLPARVQLRRSGSSACWETSFATASQNDELTFKGKSD